MTEFQVVLYITHVSGCYEYQQFLASLALVSVSYNQESSVSEVGSRAGPSCSRGVTATGRGWQVVGTPRCSEDSCRAAR